MLRLPVVGVLLGIAGCAHMPSDKSELQAPAGEQIPARDANGHSGPALTVALDQLDWPDLTLHVRLFNTGDEVAEISEFALRNDFPPRIVLLDPANNEWKLDVRAIPGMHSCATGAAIERTVVVNPGESVSVAIPATQYRWMHDARGRSIGSPNYFWWIVDAQVEAGERAAIEEGAPPVCIHGEGVVPFVDTTDKGVAAD